MDDLTITVYIADRPYRLKIRAEEEPVIQRAVDDINERIREYSGTYAYNDRQDLLAMAALSYAGKSIDGKQPPPGEDQPEVLEKLEHLHRIIDRQAV